VARLTFLGSSSAVPAIGHDNAFLVVEGAESTLLVDCAGSPLLKLQEAGIDPGHLGHLILTHDHPDHIYGFPVLVLGLWLLRSPRSLQVIGLPEALRTARDLLALFRPQDWPGFRPPDYREVDVGKDELLLDLPDLLVTGRAAQHLVPSLALRFVSRESGGAVVYSGDTGPSERVARFARGAQVLIHEAAGTLLGHSSAADAGRVAQTAGVDKLFLIHYPAHADRLGSLLAEARQHYSGRLDLARDMESLEF
jgi:ribonuclease Z